MISVTRDISVTLKNIPISISVLHDQEYKNKLLRSYNSKNRRSYSEKNNINDFIKKDK